MQTPLAVPSAIASSVDRAGYDAVGADRRHLVSERDEQVVPRRIRRLDDVGRRRIWIGVGVTVKDADDGEPVGLGGAVGRGSVARVDRVETRGALDVLCGHDAGQMVHRKIADQEAAALERQLAQAVRHHLV